MAADGQYSDSSNRGNLENHPHRAYDGETIRATVERLMFEADMTLEDDDIIGHGMAEDALENVWTWIYAHV